MKRLQDPIDIVYVWADFKDMKWCKKREKYRKKFFGTKEKISLSKNSMNELKFSLRSVERNFKNLNKVFVVTDNQVPEWLELNNSKIEIVDHKQIIPEIFLPTFNPVVIESFIHKIPGLSENFLYMNDDFFINKKIDLSFFFDKKKIHPVLGRWIIPKNNTDNRHLQTVKKTCDILDLAYGSKIRLTLAHRPQPLRVDLMIKYEKRYQDELQKMRVKRFRNCNNICFHNYLVSFSSYYENYARFHFLWEKDMFYWTNDLKSNYKKFKRFRRQKMFCIQEDRSIELNENAIIQFNNLMEDLYPRKSSFEK